MRKWISILLVLLLGLGISACAKAESTPEPGETVYKEDIQEYIVEVIDSSASIVVFEHKNSEIIDNTLTVTCLAMYSDSNGENVGTFTLTYIDVNGEWSLEKCRVKLDEANKVQTDEETTLAASEMMESEIHRYSYHVEDCTWTQAFSDAIEKGGYLVHIDSQEEFDYIISEIEALGYQDMYFYLGGRRDIAGTSYYWVDKNNMLVGDILNEEKYWGNAVWHEGEPTIEYNGTAEFCVEMHKDPEHGWGWNDVSQSILAQNMNAYGSYRSGTVAYIVEYED